MSIGTLGGRGHCLALFCTSLVEGREEARPTKLLTNSLYNLRRIASLQNSFRLPAAGIRAQSTVPFNGPLALDGYAETLLHTGRDCCPVRFLRLASLKGGVALQRLPWPAPC